MSSFSLTSYFLGHGDKKKNRLLKGEDDKGFSMRGQESKVLAKDEDDETILFVADLFLA